ncbi:MAG TPA: PorP/SprF family type IX secretion system membrane protein [Saprospiraceae bacterium]|nr:PorP/SprF family type IX secretion system membrane protein [Saprospiraceae bacterium]
MYVRKLLSLFAVVLFLGSLSAQDIHFTQFYMSPMTLNPAMAGKFEGTVRIGGIYRDQFRSVINQKDIDPSVKNAQYKTPGIYVDAPIIRGFRRNDWVGVGLSFFSDKAGQGGLAHTGSKIGATYHLAVDKRANTVISIGAAYGGEQRKVDNGKFFFERGYTNSTNPNGANHGYQSGQSGESETNTDDKYTDIDAGVVLTSKLNKMMDFNIGFSMLHLTQPNYSLLGTTGGTGGGGGNQVVYRRAVLHGQFNAKLTDRFSINPAFLFQTQKAAQEILLQGMAGYLFDKEKDITLNFGLGYRMRDAMQAIVGMRYKALNVGLAYDINVSNLNTVSRYRGGFELAANYIIKIYKPAIIKPKVLCPRF